MYIYILNALSNLRTEALLGQYHQPKSLICHKPHYLPVLFEIPTIQFFPVLEMFQNRRNHEMVFKSNCTILMMNDPANGSKFWYLAIKKKKKKKFPDNFAGLQVCKSNTSTIASHGIKLHPGLYLKKQNKTKQQSTTSIICQRRGE